MNDIQFANEVKAWLDDPNLEPSLKELIAAGGTAYSVLGEVKMWLKVHPLEPMGESNWGQTIIARINGLITSETPKLEL